jgi:hypothetical protein
MSKEVERYPGINEYVGKSGRYIITYEENGDPTIDIYLKSVVIYNGDSDSPVGYFDRDRPDITIWISPDDDIWLCSSLEVYLLGADGVNEFLSALFNDPKQVDNADDCFKVIRNLLDQKDVPWGKSSD